MHFKFLIRQTATCGLDCNSKNALLSWLETLSPKDKLEAIRHYLYLNHPSILRDLVPLLSHDAPLMNILPTDSNNQLWVRMCDVATVVMLTGLRLSVSFAQEVGTRQFHDAEIAHLQQFVEARRP